MAVLLLFVCVGLLVPVRNSAFRQIIGRELDVDSITHQDTYTVTTHAARDGREDDMLTVLDLYLKERVRLFVYNHTRQFNQFFFHIYVDIPDAFRKEIMPPNRIPAGGDIRSCRS